VATDFDYKAFRLLRAIYDVAEGNPGPPVRGIDAEHKAGIDYSWQEYTPLVRHLKDMGWIAWASWVTACSELRPRAFER
jgi:hypothetical protein